jgi:hypothetical protein
MTLRGLKWLVDDMCKDYGPEHDWMDAELVAANGRVIESINVRAKKSRRTGRVDRIVLTVKYELGHAT